VQQDLIPFPFSIDICNDSVHSELGYPVRREGILLLINGRDLGVTRWSRNLFGPLFGRLVGLHRYFRLPFVLIDD